MKKIILIALLASSLFADVCNMYVDIFLGKVHRIDVLLNMSDKKEAIRQIGKLKNMTLDVVEHCHKDIGDSALESYMVLDEATKPSK